MKIKVKDFGPIKSADFELGDFSVITGFNNTGKTYISYAIYGFLKTWSSNITPLSLHKEVDLLNDEGAIEIDLKKYEKKVLENFENLSDKFSTHLHTIFSANEDEFKKSEIRFSFNKKNINYDNGYNIEVNRKSNPIIKAKKDPKSTFLKVTLPLLQEDILAKRKQRIPSKMMYRDVLSELINKTILTEVLPEPFIITSERTGISIFQNELDINKNVLFEKIMQSDKEKFDFDPFDYLDDVVDRYSIPIKDGIDRVRDIKNEFKKNSYISKEHPEILRKLEKITGIGYKNIKGEYFLMYKDGRKKIPLPMYLGSASSRALIDLYIFIKHSAKEDDLLIIDEPELNLHPSAQIHIARLLVALSNIGIKVLVTTHSDYIVKELNNLLMLDRDFKDKENFKKKFGYSKNEYLKSMNFYIAEKETLNSVEIDEFGLTRTNFDKSIDDLIEASETLYDKLS